MNTRIAMLALGALCAPATSATLDNAEEPACLVVSLDGTVPVPAASPYAADFDGDGVLEYIRVPDAGGAYLVHDANGNGIDAWSELISSHTLAAFDDNGDNFIDDQDAAYTTLQLWSNGSVFYTLQQAGIATIFSSSSGFGGTGFFRDSGNIGYMIDADFQYEGVEWEFPEGMAECDEGNPRGDCKAYRVDEGQTAIGWKCHKDGAECTGNTGAKGKCDSPEAHVQGTIYVNCICDASDLSPVIDTRWSIGLGALLLALTIGFQLHGRTSVTVRR